MKLIRNKHLFSISHMKYGNVGGKNRCFMTANKEADCATADRIWRLYVVRGRVTMRNLRKRE
jgi:hypothetical protein